MDLHAVLAARHDEVMRRWRANVEGTIAPETMHSAELVDHLPLFLKEIVAALREDAGLRPNGPPPQDSTTAGTHGAQRLRLGFSLDAVVREYGALRDAVVATARDAGAQITFRELQVLSNAIISGIAGAVTQYTHQRDAELLRLANEHFSFVAHELRNPISTAMMAVEGLKQRGLLPPEDRMARALERALRSTTSLIDETLTAARVASGIELHRKPTTLAALFEEAEMGAESEAEMKGIELHFTIDNDAMIEVDRRLVSSALDNLVRNGVKYSHPSSVIEVRGRIANGTMTIEVEDACGGLPPGKVEQAFAPFVRLDERQSGFGLGLAIARQAAAAHGGSIRVQNVPGKGCIFVLEMPV